MTKSINAKSEVKFAQIAKSRDGFSVSKISLWTDIIWRLDTTTPGQRISLGWEFPLPDGSLSTEAQHSTLLESFREVYWGMLSDGGTYGKSLKPGSAPMFGTGMRELFRWMVYRGFNTFADLDKKAHADYLEDIPIILADRSRFYSFNVKAYDEYIVEQSRPHEDICVDEESNPDISGEDSFSYSQVFYRVMVLYFIFSQKDALRSSGLPVMTSVPFSGKTTSEVTRTITKYVVNRIPPLPNEVALPLLQESLKWIDFKAEDIIFLQTEYLAERDRALSRGLSVSAAINWANRVIRNFEFQRIAPHQGPWRHKIAAEEPVTHPEYGERRLKSTQILRTYVYRARDAAVLTLQYMVGMRIGEICSTEGGWKLGNELPDCIIRRFSKNGVLEMFFLKAILSKGVKHPREEEWLLGCRPVGSLHYPAPVRAVMMLERLYRPWRQLGNSKKLIVSFTQSKSLPIVEASIGDITSAALLRGTKHFVFSELDLSKLPDTNEHGEDLAMYRDSNGLCIRTHQGRKTFAAYVLESRTSLLKAVSEHFKHLTVAITESAYFPAISRLRGDAESARFSQSVSFFVEAIQGKKIYGRMAEVIDKYFGKKFWSNVGSIAELERKVHELVLVHDLRIFFSSHGNCLIKANPLQSRCRDCTGGTSWQKDTPDYSARSPSLCSGCGCFAMDRTHFDFWKSRELDLTEVVNMTASTGNSREFRVHKARLEQAKKVIKLFEEK